MTRLKYSKGSTEFWLGVLGYRSDGGASKKFTVCDSLQSPTFPHCVHLHYFLHRCHNFNNLVFSQDS
jgi:hypothetical protein